MRANRAQKVAPHHPAATGAIRKTDNEQESARQRSSVGKGNTGIQCLSIASKVAPTNPNPTRREGSQRRKSYEKKKTTTKRISKTAHRIPTRRRRSSSMKMKIRSKAMTSGTKKRTEDLNNKVN